LPTVHKVDFVSYEEVANVSLDFRFYLDKDPLKLVGWNPVLALGNFKELASMLSDPKNSPLDKASREKIPSFPATTATGRSSKKDRDAEAKLVEAWFVRLMNLIPKGVKSDLVDATNLPPPPPVQAATTNDSANWRKVKDPETGEVFYHNKITGETRNDAPTSMQNVKEEKQKLQPGWERVEDSGEVYYLNSATGETTWDAPLVATTKTPVKQQLDLKDLLSIEELHRMLLLKDNVERLSHV